MGDAHAKLLGFLLRDMVIANAAAGQEFDPHRGPGFQIFRRDQAGVSADGIAAFGKFQVIRRGDLCGIGIINAVLFAVWLTIGLFVERTEGIKHDLHGITSLIIGLQKQLLHGAAQITG